MKHTVEESTEDDDTEGGSETRTETETDKESLGLDDGGNALPSGMPSFRVSNRDVSLPLFCVVELK